MPKKCLPTWVRLVKPGNVTGRLPLELKTKSCHDDNFVVTGGTGGYRYDNIQYRIMTTSVFHLFIIIRTILTHLFGILNT